MGIIGVRKRLDHLLRWFQLFFSKHLPVFLAQNNAQICSINLTPLNSTAFHCTSLDLSRRRPFSDETYCQSFLSETFLLTAVFPVQPFRSLWQSFWPLLKSVGTSSAGVGMMTWNHYTRIHSLHTSLCTATQKTFAVSCIMLEVCKLCGSFVAAFWLLLGLRQNHAVIAFSPRRPHFDATINLNTSGTSLQPRGMENYDSWVHSMGLYFGNLSAT